MWVNFFKPLSSEFYSWQIGAKQTVQFGSVGICLCSAIWILCVLSFYKDEGIIKMKTLMKMICLGYLVCYRQKCGLNEKALDFAGGVCSYMEKTKQNKTWASLPKQKLHVGIQKYKVLKAIRWESWYRRLCKKKKGNDHISLEKTSLKLFDTKMIFPLSCSIFHLICCQILIFATFNFCLLNFLEISWEN